MPGRPVSLLRQGVYSLAWVKDFYDRVANGGPLRNAWQNVVKLVPAGPRPAVR